MSKKYLFLLIFYIISINGISQTKISSEWLTFFEKSNFLETSRYKESIEYFKKFEKSSPYAKMIKFGVTPQGRDLYCLIVSKDKCFTPEKAKRSGIPVVMINNGIHSGEIEGKDASMLLLRDILITNYRLLTFQNL